MKKVGYIRMKGSLRNLDNKIEKILEKGVEFENIYQDISSNKNNAFEEMKNSLSKGDIVYINSIMEISNDIDDIRKELTEIIIEKCADIKVIETKILDTTSEVVKHINSKEAITDFFVSIVKESNIKQMGRPRNAVPDSFITEVNLWRTGKQNATETIQKLNLSRATFYRLVKQKGL